VGDSVGNRTNSGAAAQKFGIIGVNDWCWGKLKEHLKVPVPCKNHLKDPNKDDTKTYNMCSSLCLKNGKMGCLFHRRQYV
jgi:hypothetical protein